jgi:hypothetical protein
MFGWRGKTPVEDVGESEKGLRMGLWDSHPLEWSSRLERYHLGPANEGLSRKPLTRTEEQALLFGAHRRLRLSADVLGKSETQRQYEKWGRLYKLYCKVNDVHSYNPALQNKPEQWALPVTPFDKGMARKRRAEARAKRPDSVSALRITIGATNKIPLNILPPTDRWGHPVRYGSGATLPEYNERLEEYRRQKRELKFDKLDEQEHFDNSRQWDDLEPPHIRKEDAK